MIKVGDQIAIRHSSKLTGKSAVLANRTGVVTKVIMSDNEFVGVRVDVRIMRIKKNYFVPAASIDDSYDVNRMRTLSLLKSTIL